MFGILSLTKSPFQPWPSSVQVLSENIPLESAEQKKLWKK